MILEFPPEGGKTENELIFWHGLPCKDGMYMVEPSLSEAGMVADRAVEKNRLQQKIIWMPGIWTPTLRTFPLLSANQEPSNCMAEKNLWSSSRK